MKTMKELALAKKTQADKIVTEKISDKKQKEPIPAGTVFHAFHDSSTRQRWHLKTILENKIPVDITLRDGMVIHNANLMGFDTHTLFIQDGEYRIMLMKGAVTSLRFKFSK